MPQHEESNPPILDPAQLRRIQAVHRGFLYQHLFAVACLFQLNTVESGKVVIERDEDIEFETEGAVYFIQVKTRSEALQPHVVKPVIAHFDAIRTRYENRFGDREMVFVLASNQEAGPKLTEELAAWPRDVHLLSPERPLVGHSILPAVSKDLIGLIGSVRDLAEALPFRSLQSETLIWKLASRVQFAATGEDTQRLGHSFKRSDLPFLFESFVDQLQEFPALPDSYRPQIDEPDLVSEARVRLITGFSGAGKTLWAASQAMHTSSTVGYFDVRDLPDTAIANSLSREMAARFLTGGSGDTARLPYGTGMEVLAALNDRISSELPPIMVLDNVQRCSVETMRGIVETCSNVQFVLLSQPGAHVSQYEVQLGLETEALRGWDRETAATVFSGNSISVSPSTARRLLTLTGGLPLYVESAARICAHTYGRDAVGFLEDIEAGEHTQSVAQEIVLEQALATLTDAEQDIIALLSMNRIPLTSNEIGTIANNLERAPENMVRVLRGLSRLGLVEQFSNATWKLHDAVSVPAQHFVERLGGDVQQACLTTLRDLLLASLLNRQDLVRLAAWTRLLGPTGQASVLADIAMDEMFYEYGDPADLKAVLEELAKDNGSNIETEYWALEALAFWDLQNGSRSGDPGPRLDRMQEIIDAHPEIDPDGPLRIGNKRMFLGGSIGNSVMVRDSFDQCRHHAVNAPDKLRLSRYNYASALYMLGANHRALQLAETLYQEYYELLDIDVTEVFGATNQKMRDLVGKVDEQKQSDLKHLADSLSLAAKIKRKLGEHPLLLGIHAAKFYMLASAWRSQMKVAQDFADDSLEMGDTEGAVLAMENYVLPLLHHFDFDGEFVEVNSHYAVLLAYDGRHNEARQQMSRLTPYIDDLPAQHKASFLNQVAMIEKIAQGELSAPTRQSPAQSQGMVDARIRTSAKVGRNAPCPCGSGRNFKKCCGGIA